jgi:hypothetical protein
MSERKLDHFSDQGHLFSATSDIIVSDFIELFFVFSIDWLSFGEKHGIRGHNTKLFRLSSNDLEFDWLKISSNDKKISLLDWSVGVLEIRNQVGFGEISGDSLDGVLEWEDMNFGQVWNFTCWSNLNHVTQSDSEIFSDSFVHSDFSLF